MHHSDAEAGSPPLSKKKNKHHLRLQVKPNTQLVKCSHDDHVILRRPNHDEIAERGLGLDSVLLVRLLASINLVQLLGLADAVSGSGHSISTVSV